MESERSTAVRSWKSKSARLVVFIFLMICAIIIAYPILYVVFGSFKENQELLLGGLNLLPEKFITDNYVQAWTMGNFARYTLNSIVISVAVMGLTLLCTSMAAYCFARKNFFGKELIWGIMLALMFVNVGSVTLRPLFELAVKVKMNKSLLAIVLISAGGGQASNIFLTRGYLNSVPKELDEAAKMDGCSFFQIYYRVILPVMKPILATVGLLSFRGAWNEYIMPLVFTMSNESLRPLTVGVVQLRNMGDGAAAWNIMFAGSAISIIPIVIIYICFSKYFMSGITQGAVKG